MKNLEWKSITKREWNTSGKSLQGEKDREEDLDALGVASCEPRLLLKFNVYVVFLLISCTLYCVSMIMISIECYPGW